MISIEEIIAVVHRRLRGWTYQRVQEDFNRRFRKLGPNRKTINKFVNKFKKTGNFADAKRCGRPSTSDDTVVRIEGLSHVAHLLPPGGLAENSVSHSRQFGKLHYRLHLKVYHIQVLHHLEQEDYAAREAKCADLVQAAEDDEEEEFMNNVLFADEASFHTCDVVNRHSAEFGPWNNHMSFENCRGIHQKFGWE